MAHKTFLGEIGFSIWTKKDVLGDHKGKILEKS